MPKPIPIVCAILFTIILCACPPSKPPATSAPAKPSIPALAGPKKRVGIFEFENKSRYGQNRLSDAAVDVLYSELQKKGAFLLYERSALSQLNREFDLINSGQVNLDTAAEAGKLTGVQAVVVGTITQFGMWEEAKDLGVYKKKVEIAEATVDIRVVDVGSGRIIYADTGSGRTERDLTTVLGFGEKASFDETMADKALREAMVKFVDNLVAQVSALPWEGRVMDVTPGSPEVLYLNAGRLSGMPAGQLLTVKRITGKLTDPATGEFRGYKTQNIGQAQVYDFTGDDASLAKMLQGAGAARGDLVTLANP